MVVDTLPRFRVSVADPGFSWRGGAPTPKSAIILQFFAENCMKIKEFGPPEVGVTAPPLDPPMDRMMLHSQVIKYSLLLLLGIYLLPKG